MIGIACIAIGIIASTWLALDFVPTKRRGALTFWRVGCVGGSFYVAKPAPRKDVASWN